MSCQPLSILVGRSAAAASRCLAAPANQQRRHLCVPIATQWCPLVASTQQLCTDRAWPAKPVLSSFRYQSSSTSETRDTTSQADTTAEDPPRPEQSSTSRNDGEAGKHVESDAGSEWRQKLLNGALRHVPEHGWTLASVEKAAGELKLSSAVVGMLEHGVADLVLHFERECNQKLLTAITDWKSQKEEAGERVGVTRIVGEAVQQRLSMIVPHLDTWPEALALFSQPSVAPHALELMLHLIDDIWYLAGDRSTDFSWYTKRATLAAIYCSTELFLLQDESPGNTATWEFLDRRMADVGHIGSVQATIRQAVCTAVELGGMSLYTAQKLSRTLPPLNSDVWTRPFSGTR